MNYKDKVIKACEDIAKEYETIGHSTIKDSCQLCHVVGNNCSFCIISKGFPVGCVHHLTYPHIYRFEEAGAIRVELDMYTSKPRAKFYRNIIPVLKKIDSKYFEPTSYKKVNFHTFLNMM